MGNVFTKEQEESKERTNDFNENYPGQVMAGKDSLVGPQCLSINFAYDQT